MSYRNDMKPIYRYLEQLEPVMGYNPIRNRRQHFPVPNDVNLYHRYLDCTVYSHLCNYYRTLYIIDDPIANFLLTSYSPISIRKPI